MNPGCWECRLQPPLYSLIETAKPNGHEPSGYLRHLFEQLPLATIDAAIDALLPWAIKPDDIPKIRQVL